VEKVLASHPGVFEVVVIPVPDDKWGEVPKALVVLKPGSHTKEEELLEFCRARLSHYKCPRTAEFLKSLPRTGTGKLLKKELREQYAAARKVSVP
jgi:fatty-acyl-CoA synthase